VLRLELDPKDASVLVDGKTPVLEANGSLLLDAGTHVISATAPEHKATNVRVLVEGDSEQTLRVPLESTAFQQSMIAPIDAEQVAAEKHDKPAVVATASERSDEGHSAAQTWAIGTLIGAGAFGATAAIFWFVGDGQYKDLEDTCAPGCSSAQVDDSGVKTSDLLSNVFLGLSAASLATSAVLFIVSAGESDDAAAGDAAPRATPVATLRIGPLGASVSGSF
jgi:hypothetical protein